MVGGIPMIRNFGPGGLVLEASEIISKETFEQTRGAVKFKAWFELFNNAIYVGRIDGHYHIRCSDSVLRAIATAGFDIYRVNTTTYAATRRIGVLVQ